MEQKIFPVSIATYIIHFKWKNNKMDVKKYQGLDHNFFDDANNAHWKDVSVDINNWIKNEGSIFVEEE